MESSNSMSLLSRRKNTHIFTRRQGQVIWRTYVEEHPEEPKFVGRMPTGYGKTESFLDAYDVLRRQRGYTHCLIIVPTGTQEDQYAESLMEKAKAMGIQIAGVITATSTGRTIRAYKEKRAEIFVVTIQRILASLNGHNSMKGNWFVEGLFEHDEACWLGCADEYHHYGEDNTWGQAIEILQRHIGQWVALSATPARRRGETVFGKPAVDISYDQALQEGVVKPVNIKVREYGVDIQLEDKTTVYMTTQQIREEAGEKPIDKWETQRQLRYLTKYCSPILYHAITELNQLHLAAKTTECPQMLIYAFSCRHAQALVNIIKDQAFNFQVDWAGTGADGKTEEQNKRVIDAFSDHFKDGILVRHHTLDILVQVNIASEGFDSKPVCVIVDLSLTGIGPQKLQQYGRGTRQYYGEALSIYVPTDSPVARVAHLLHQLFDLDLEVLPDQRRPPTCECCDYCPLCEHHDPPKPLPKSHVIHAELIGGLDYEPTREEVVGIASMLGQESSQRSGALVVYDPEHKEEDYVFIKNALTAFYRQMAVKQEEDTLRPFWQSKVDRAAGQVAYDVARKHQSGGFEKALLGTLKKRIHIRWKQEHLKHDDMFAEEFEAKYDWLCALQTEVREGETPRWLRPTV